MKKIYLAAALVVITTPSSFLFAADPTPTLLALSSGSHVYLTGNSTLHPYASTSTLTQIVAVLAYRNVAEATAPVVAVLTDIIHRAPFQKFEVTIPVKGLKSGESGLDKNLYKAMKSDQTPEIHFTLTHYEASPAAADGSVPFQAAGQLSIAGVVKDITLQGTARLATPGLVMDGEYGLKMSDFGIKPPKLLLGTIKVADPVLIHFHLPFELKRGLS